MARSDDEVEQLIGRQFALEAMLTQIVWAWAKDQPHPPTALASYLQPLEEQIGRMASRSPKSVAMQAARSTVREIAEELERTLRRQAALLADDKGPVQ